MIVAERARGSARQNRGTIFVEDAELIGIEAFAGDQYVLRMHSPECARRATAGSFVHIQCDEQIPMRRPLSIMRSNREEAWIEVLFKVVGSGLRALANKTPGDRISVIGPIGQGFSPDPERPETLLIGGGVGIPPMVFLAQQMLQKSTDWQPVVLMGSEIPFPFELQQSEIKTDWLAGGHASSMPLLEGWGVPCRLASLSDFAGCHKGFVTDLARIYLQSLDRKRLERSEIFSCGPTPMLKAVADLASEFNLPCQVSLEEFMACAVGGCAGCAVEIHTQQGPAMKRVCVDGPVFEAAAVFGN